MEDVRRTQLTKFSVPMLRRRLSRVEHESKKRSTEKHKEEEPCATFLLITELRDCGRKGLIKSSPANRLLGARAASSLRHFG